MCKLSGMCCRPKDLLAVHQRSTAAAALPVSWATEDSLLMSDLGLKCCQPATVPKQKMLDSKGTAIE